MTHSDPTDDTWKNSPFAQGQTDSDAVDKNFDEMELEAKVDALADAVRRQAEILEEIASTQQDLLDGAGGSPDDDESSDKIWGGDSPFSRGGD